MREWRARLPIGTIGLAVMSLAPMPVSPCVRGQCDSWQELGGGVSGGGVGALAIFENELIAGGNFTSAGGVAANHIARWNGSGWEPLAGGLNFSVSSLVVYNGDLIASVGPSRWAGESWEILGGGVSGYVYALAVYNGELIVGGSFTTAGGTSANRIARWNGVSWGPLGTGFSGDYQTGLGPHVEALAVYDGQLVAGGLFTSAGGQYAQSIARWDGAQWWPMGSMGGSPPVVRALHVYGDELIVGGHIDNALGNPDTNSIASWNGSSYQALGTGLNNDVLDLATYNGDLLVGGFFTAADGHGDRIALWNGASWWHIGSFRGSPSGGTLAVSALIVHNGELVAGGNFSVADSQTAKGIAHWVACDTIGACCMIDGSCAVISALDCQDAFSGTFQGANTTCTNNPGCPQPCPADTDGNFSVNVDDLLTVINAWNQTFQTHNIAVREFEFDPPMVQAKSGDTLHWFWESGIHSVTSGQNCSSDGQFNQPISAASPTFDHAIGSDFRGAIPYFCIPHCAKGMVGNVDVQPFAADVNDDVTVNVDDLLAVINAWGPCP